MNQKVPKPLVKVYQKPIISWIIDSFKINNIDIAVIINPKQESFFEEYNNEAKFVYQKNQRGTGHAVMMAESSIKCDEDSITVVLARDCPLVQTETLKNLIQTHQDNRGLVTVFPILEENQIQETNQN